MRQKNWKKFHRFQEKPGWCGPAVVQMALAFCDIKKSQAEIAKDIYQDWWGTSQNLLLAYLSRFFKLVNYKPSAKISDLSFHLKKEHIVIVNWWDDLGADEADGHYSIVAGFDNKNKKITLVDPSTSRPGIWTMAAKEFKSRWYDYLDVHSTTWVDGWMLWLDPKSKLSPQK